MASHDPMGVPVCPKAFSGRSTRLGPSRGWTTRTQGARATPMPANTGAGPVLLPASSNSPVWPVSHTSRPAFHAPRSARPCDDEDAQPVVGRAYVRRLPRLVGGVNPSTWMSGVRQWHTAFSRSPARRAQRRSSSSHTDGADRFRMQRCWSPSRFLEDVKGFPQDQLRVALPYRAGVTADMDDAARDRLWDATARGMACAARRRHVRRVRPLPLTDGLTVNGRGHSLGNARRLRAACRRPVMGGDGLIFGQLP